MFSSICIIGAGNMGQAMGKGFLSQNCIAAEKLTFVDLDEAKLQSLSEELGTQGSTNLDSAKHSELVMLAVKPQSFPALAEQLKQHLSKDSVLLSVMAGVSIQSMQDLLDHKKIVRCMPNTPALINEGMTAWYAGENLSEEETENIRTLLSSTGKELALRSEELLHDVTALSGSGPGFFFQVFEDWIAASSLLDLSEEQNTQLLLQTLKGSIKLLEESGESPSTLREKVTSKGGTTAAGLEVLQAAKLSQTFKDMLFAAKKRSEDLSSSS